MEMEEGGEDQEQHENESMEVIVLSEEDFSRLAFVQIQSDQDYEEISHEGQICDSVVSLEENEKHRDPETNSKILEIAFESIVGTYTECEVETISNTSAINDVSKIGDMPLTPQLLVVESEQTTSALEDELIDNAGIVEGRTFNESNTSEGMEIEFEGEDISDEIEVVVMPDEEDDESALTKAENTLIQLMKQNDSEQYAHALHDSKTPGDIDQLNQKQHTEFEPYACAVCEARFHERSKLQLHMFEHTNERPHECVECKKSFRLESVWRKHMNKFHVTDFSGPTGCAACKKLFRNETYFYRHQQLKHGGLAIKSVPLSMPYNCSKCPMLFSNQDTLVRHIESKHRSFPCFYCDKRFSKKISLKKHDKEVHYKERPYACFKCWKRFTNGPEANAHLIEVHSISLVRPVGTGRQKDDMYSTNFYEKSKQPQGNVESNSTLNQTPQEKKDPINVISTTVTESPISEDPDHVYDLAARLKGKLSVQPFLIKNRKTYISQKRNAKIPSSSTTGKPLTPFFTAPKVYPIPNAEGCDMEPDSSIDVRKTNWKTKFTSAKTIKKPINSKAHIKKTTAIQLKKEYQQKCIVNLGKDLDGIISNTTNRVGSVKRTRNRRKGSDNPISAYSTDLETEKLSTMSNQSVSSILNLKEVRVKLERLPESVLQEYQRHENSNKRVKSLSNTNKAGSISKATGIVYDTKSSLTENTITPSSSFSERPRRTGVKSIYQRGRESTYENIRGVTNQTRTETLNRTFPEDKRSFSGRREKRCVPARVKMFQPPKLATAFDLFQLKTKEKNETKESMGLTDEEDLKNEARNRSGRLSILPKISVRESLKQSKAEVLAEEPSVSVKSSLIQDNLSLPNIVVNKPSTSSLEDTRPTMKMKVKVITRNSLPELIELDG